MTWSHGVAPADAVDGGAEAEPAGVKFYRYQPGFMHHKVILVDDDLAAVGTANFDNRSIRLNFELMVVFASRSFASDVCEMFEKDFEACRQVHTADFARRSYLFHFAVRLARLLASRWYQTPCWPKNRQTSLCGRQKKKVDRFLGRSWPKSACRIWWEKM